MNEQALRVALHRLRKRYRELLREELPAILARSEDVDQVLRLLLGAPAG
jgi:RNA polymerase sigma-70 factor (ECF subfamily)